MARLFYILLTSILLFQSCVRSYSPRDPADQTFSESVVKRDFKLFREILETAHPALAEYVSKKRLSYLFDSVYKSLAGGISYRDFYTKLSFLINEIECSHTHVTLPPYIIDTLYNRSLFFPVPVILIEGRLLVNSDHDLSSGTELVAINDLPVSNILDSLMLYNPVDGRHRQTQQYLASGDFGFDYYVRFGGAKQFKTVIKDSSGIKKTVFVDAINLAELDERKEELYYFDVSDVNYSLTIHDQKKYASIRLTTFNYDSYSQQSAFEAFLKNSFELLQKRPDISSLVIDLRENGGGDLYNCFLLYSYLSDQPFSEYKSVHAKIKRVPFTTMLSDEYDLKDMGLINRQLDSSFKKTGNFQYTMPDSLIEKWIPNKKRFAKKVYIITNWKVVSSASYFVLLAKNSGRAKVIGWETAGGDYTGNGFKRLKYTLPGSQIRLVFSFANLEYTHRSPRRGGGVIPDYVVHDTYESFNNNDDHQANFVEDSLILKK